MATLGVIANAAARDGSPSDGDMYYQSDLQQIILYDDSLSAWKEYTPAGAPYDLDGTNVMTVTPNFHFDASKINGVDATGNPSNAASFTGIWTSRTNGVVTIAQATGSLQPTFYTSGTNSKPYLSVDGDYCPISPFTDKFFATDELTFFVVAEKLSGGNLPFFGSAGAAQNATFLNYGTNGKDYLFYLQTGASNAKDRASIDGSEATYETTRMYLMTRDSSDNGDVFVDGNNQNALLASTFTGPVIANFMNDTVGTYPMPSDGLCGIGRQGNWDGKGHIYEIAMWNSNLSTADRNKLITYVNTKYGDGRNAADSGTFDRVPF